MRLEEKEQFLTKKTKQLQDLTDEKSTLTGEIRDMKDMLDVKERKINVLQKKVRKANFYSNTLHYFKKCSLTLNVYETFLLWVKFTLFREKCSTLYYKLSNYSFYTKMNILKAWSDNSA